MNIRKHIFAQLAPSAIQSILVQFENQEAASYYSVSVIKKKRQFLPYPGDLGNLVTSPSDLNTKIPAIVLFTGKGILEKETSLSNSDPFENFQALFPGTPPDGFYMELANTSDINRKMFIGRKDLINKHLDKLLREGLQILDFHISSFSPSQEENFKAYDQPYKSIISAVCNYLRSTSIGLRPQSEAIIQSNKEFFHSQVYRISLPSTLAFFFIVLLSNYLFFVHYSSRQSELRIKAENIIELREKTSQLELQRKNSLKMLNDRGIGIPSCKSFIADRLIAGIPEGIALSEFVVSPYRIHGSPPASIDTEESKILISGYSKDNFTLDAWIKTLKKNTLLRDVILSNLKGGRDNQNNYFLITVILRPL